MRNRIASRVVQHWVVSRAKKLVKQLAAVPGKTGRWVRFVRDFRRFKILAAKDNRFPIRFADWLPCCNDNTGALPFDTHYTYHPAWAARIIAKTKPTRHIDVSSILSFSTVVSAFVPVEFYDFRPAGVMLPNFLSGKADLTRLPFADDSIESLSCMHVVEHIGLGRYGDPLNPDGDLMAVRELRRVTAPGGQVLFVVPVGRSRIQFNGHRIYSYGQIMNYFPDFNLQEFMLVPDEAHEEGIINNATELQADAQSYGCGCFWFVKRQ